MRTRSPRFAIWFCMLVMALTGLFASGCYVHTRPRGQRVYIRDGGHHHHGRGHHRGRGHGRGRGRGHGQGHRDR